MVHPRRYAQALPEPTRRRPGSRWRAFIGGIVPLLAACLLQRGATAADVPVSANVANLFAGEQKIVEGKVVSTARDGNTVTLRFGAGPHDFTVTLIIPLLSNFPSDPERVYRGKQVRVAGVIRDFRGVPEMVIRDAGDIQVVGESAPAVAVSASLPAAASAPAEAAPDAGLQHEVETLNERLRVMDERLRALEGRPSSGELPPASPE